MIDILFQAGSVINSPLCSPYPFLLSSLSLSPTPPFLSFSYLWWPRSAFPSQ